MKRTPFTDAVEEVMTDPEIRGRYPDGLTSNDVLAEIRRKEADAFPLCTWIDVHDELEYLYGPPQARRES